jgi:hypothetical protein
MKMIEKDTGWKGNVYFIYESDGKKIYVASNPTSCLGLRGYWFEEIELEDDGVEFVTFQEKLPPFSKGEPKAKKMHPVLYQLFKVEGNWQLYEGIYEGVPEDWVEFARRLGHEP